MNGRIYDPKLGRMLQADPFIQSPTNSQSLNRYSYVLNNPLSYTDPSGYFSFSRFVKKWGRMIVAAVATYFTAGMASGWEVGWGFAAGTAGNAAIAGAVAGFVGGGILTGTLKGAFYGGLTGTALGGIGATGWNNAAKSLASGAASGITTELQGGRFGHGFLSAGMGFWSGLKFGGPPEFGKFLASSLAGGTISKLTGGKFANGAISAGLAYVVAAGASVMTRQGVSSSDPGSEANESMRDELEQRLLQLRDRGDLNSNEKFMTADAAATEVLNIVAPLSSEYGFELVGNIYSVDKYFQYTFPVIGGSDSGLIYSDYVGYHTHPSGGLLFSNSTTPVRHGNDARFVNTTRNDLYLGVFANGAVRIGVCSPYCPGAVRGGTPPTRVIQ